MEISRDTSTFVETNVTKCVTKFSGSMLRVCEIAPNDPNFKKHTSRSIKYKKTDSGRFTSSLVRSRNKIKEHVYNNFPPKESNFITLTYKDAHKKDKFMHDEALRDFENFIRKLRRRYKNLKYLAVPELQHRRGDIIHFHILVNKSYVTEQSVRDMWGLGFGWTKVVFGHPRKVGSYLSKYMTKTPYVTKSRQLYYVSKNLTKSTITRGFIEPYKVATELLKMFNVKSPDNEFLVTTGYGKFKISEFYLGPPITYPEDT